MREAVEALLAAAADPARGVITGWAIAVAYEDGSTRTTSVPFSSKAVLVRACEILLSKTRRGVS